jgi:apolipoprotein N-acyltransferase
LQAGFFGLLVKPENIQRLYRVIGLAAVWTLLEWSRLFFLSGYTWNPAGIALTSNVYALQGASLFGVFGLSFWVILINALALRAWINRPAKRPVLLWGLLALLPYAFGFYQLETHKESFSETLENNNNYVNALLVQTAFPAEEAIEFTDKHTYVAFVMDEWRKILEITKSHIGKKIDLIALPEYVVPFGAYTYLYPQSYVQKIFDETYGKEHSTKLPSLEEPFAREYQTAQGDVWFVNNAYWAQGISNVFNSELVAGMEDIEKNEDEDKYYSAALHFKPGTNAETFSSNRYSKRILLPMAEYIPFSFCRDLAAHYGIQGSFTPGEEATIAQGGQGPFSMSICYEETFGNLMREGRQNGSEMLVNLTSDVWYPNSRLPQQHADHARLRTVENGIPLLRACNTGVTMAIDSFGRTVGCLESSDEETSSEWLADALYVSVPKYHYQTLYSGFGDSLIIGFSCLALLFFFIPAYRKV